MLRIGNLPLPIEGGEEQLRKRAARALGVEITEAVINMIEGAVWEINTENKKALVLTGERSGNCGCQ